MADGAPYTMSLSLNVLNHLGLNLYSNTPAVLAEVIANAWDADATEVRVTFDREAKLITVADNGHGMDQDDINDKYLRVGYQKRNAPDFHTPGGRKPMGRKGIGKLSLFSIADQIFVYSRKAGGQNQSFVMDADQIKAAIDAEDPSVPRQYVPEPTAFDVDIAAQGTVIKIAQLKKIRLTQASIDSLRKRLARRFGLLDARAEFRIFIEGAPVTFADRDYFHKARFLFQYGTGTYAQYCPHLDKDSATQQSLHFRRPNRFNENGCVAETGGYAVQGWIAIARHSHDLDGQGQDDNLNKITLVVRGKVAQEDILQEFRLGGMMTKYLYGEIHADFLDEDDKDDIATSSRQKILEDDPRYCALKAFLDGELRRLWVATDKLKAQKGLEAALAANPHVRAWYDELRPRRLQEAAKGIFALIDRAGVDEKHKHALYANGILAFETLKMDYALAALETVDVANLDLFLAHLADIDAIEAARYHEIIRERLNVIRQFQGKTDENVIERVLQEYVFDHLWLLDPAWERATRYAHMEERLQSVINDRNVRLDIRYRRVGGAHVIIELKRASRRLRKVDIEAQVRTYMDALETELKQDPVESRYPIEAICLVGRLPSGWANPEVRRRDEESLKAYSIRVITYQELIDNAFSAYAKFVEASEAVDKLRRLLDNVRAYGEASPRAAL